MDIIDAQIHGVQPATNWSSTFTAEQAIEAEAELAVASMDAVGVAAALVQAPMQVVNGYLATLHGTLAEHPELRAVIDHVGLFTPPVRVQPGPHLFESLPDVLALAKFPNVAVKFTGVPSLSERPYPYDDVWPHMHRL